MTSAYTVCWLMCILCTKQVVSAGNLAPANVLEDDWEEGKLTEKEILDKNLVISEIKLK